MRLFGNLLPAALLAWGLFLPVPGAADEKWDMATPFPDSSFHTQNIRWFAAELHRASSPRLELLIHSDSSLFKLPEIKTAVRNGKVNIGEILLSAHGAEDPLFETDAIPFLVSGVARARALMIRQRPLLEKRLAAQGLKLLFSVAWPGQGIISAGPLTEIGDLKGLNFRAYNAVTTRFATLAKANGVLVQQRDLGAAFASGVVQATMGSPLLAVELKTIGAAPHYYDVEAVHLRNAVVVNERAFRRLPSELQAFILEAAARAESRGWEVSAEQAAEAKRRLIQSGVAVTAAPPALRQQLGAIGDVLIEEWSKKIGASTAALLKEPM